MSRLYLNHPEGSLGILGSERHWFGSLSDKVGMSLLDGFYLTELAKWMTVDAFGMTPPGTVYTAQAVDHVRLAFRHGDDRTVLSWRGQEVDPWTLTLNTCMRLGSFPVRLAARLHAQCEIHCWVDSPHLDWLAGVIVSGLRSGVMREGAGWEAAVVWLREHNGQCPVVFSSSVTDDFPGPHVTTWEPPVGEDGERDWDAWYDLPDAEQWETSMAALRDAPGQLEIEPEDFADYTFGNGLSWLDLQGGEDHVRGLLLREREAV
jgi:hypothetical protein